PPVSANPQAVSVFYTGHGPAGPGGPPGGPGHPGPAGTLLSALPEAHRRHQPEPSAGGGGIPAEQPRLETPPGCRAGRGPGVRLCADGQSVRRGGAAPAGTYLLGRRPVFSGAGGAQSPAAG